MRSFAIIFLFGMLLIPAFTQTTKPKQTSAKTPAKKPTPSRSTAAKPKVAATPKPKIDEKAEWEKALATADAYDRIGEIKKYLAAFPKTKRQAEALETILKLRADIGTERLLAGDLDNAAKLFKAGAAEAPKPVADQLFNDTLVKFPANLFFRGKQDEAIDIAKTIEERVDTNPTQLITIANFYLSVENGEEAKRVAENIIKIAPASAVAYQTLALANRMQFKLEDSAAAYAKALELDPESLIARHGLAEMKRSLGKSVEAVTLYQEILAKDAANAPAKTGLILSLFDAGKRADAETELKASLDANAGNVILLAGLAYWYAANSIGDKAVEYGQKAVASDPRYIWSHIAMARGFLLLDKPLDAERTLMAARKHGNFPTLEYEIATMRASAGLYREAADSLDRMFVMKDGQVATDLGLRVPVQADTFIKLIEDERRASIFAPTSADTLENSTRLRALFEFTNAVNASDADAAGKYADAFVGGGDRMRTHRQLFVASHLVAKKLAPAKVLELTKSAVTGVDAGLDVKHATVAVLADEIYQPRSLAAARNEYVQAADLPRATLLAIVRGRIEELSGAAFSQMDNRDESIVRFKRAIGVLPAESAWWRSTMWRLAGVYEAAGNNAEALDTYYKSYRAGTPDPIKYAVIESLFKRVNGNTDGLELKIGANPLKAVSGQAVAQVPTPEPTPLPTPEPSPTIPANIPIKAVSTPTPDQTPVPEPTVPSIPAKSEPTAEPTPGPTPESTPEIVADPTLPVLPDATPTPAPRPKETSLFPPVVITIPAAQKTVEGEVKPTPAPVASKKIPDETTVAIKPCTVTSSEPSITLQKAGSELAIIIGTETDEDLSAMTAVSSSPNDVEVRRQEIAAIKGRALFVVRTANGKAGLYQITFSVPCGKKDVEVRVR